MKDELKTKRQLINELTELRQRVAELETLQTQQRQEEELLDGTIPRTLKCSQLVELSPAWKKTQGWDRKTISAPVA